jgi:hypothetical protein
MSPNPGGVWSHNDLTFPLPFFERFDPPRGVPNTSLQSSILDAVRELSRQPDAAVAPITVGTTSALPPAWLASQPV